MGRWETTYAIRPYRRADRPAVRRICMDTAWMGSPAPELIGDPWIWAEYWTRFFTDRQARHLWVARRRAGGQVVGYLTGAPDVGQFDRFAAFLLPGIVGRVVRRRLIRRPGARRALLAMARSLLAGELSLPPAVAGGFPATFHFNLIRSARRQGLGSALLGRFLEQMRAAGVPGVHAQALSLNRPAAAALRRAGFRRVASRPLRAFAHHDARPMAIDTWVLKL